MKDVLLQIVSSPGCSHCKAFEEYWHSIEKEWPNVRFEDLSIITPAGQALASKHMIFASPGIILNGELFATGGFDKEAFLKKIKEISGA